MIREVLTDAKVAIGAVTASVTTAAANEFNWIPDDIGKLSVLVGVALTSILIIAHSFKLYIEQRSAKIKERREEELHQAELAIKQEQLKALKKEGKS